MLSISHMAAGAFVMTVVPSPILAVPLILASHYLFDAVIHWDCGTGLSSGKKTVNEALLHEVWDLVAGVLFIYIAFQSGHEAIAWNAWIGSGIGILPDLLEAPSNFLKLQPRFLTAINRFHDRFHNSTPNLMLGLTPQLILLLVIYFVS